MFTSVWVAVNKFTAIFLMQKLSRSFSQCLLRHNHEVGRGKWCYLNVVAETDRYIRQDKIDLNSAITASTDMIPVYRKKRDDIKTIVSIS